MLTQEIYEVKDIHRHTRPAPGYTAGLANAGRSDKVGAGIFLSGCRADTHTLSAPRHTSLCLSSVLF